MKKSVIAAASLLLSTAALAQQKPVVDIITSIPLSGSGGQIGHHMTTILNSVQSEREYRFGVVPGAQGDTAALRVLTLSKAGQSALLFNGITTFTTNRLNKINDKDAFDRDNDFVLSYGIGKNVLALLVNPESDIKTLDQLLARIRSKPTSYSAATLTSPAAIMMNEIFLTKFNLKDRVKQINYANPAEIALAVMNKEVDYTIFTIPDMLNLKALLVSSDRRLHTFPDAPTGKEAGIEEFNLSTILLYAVPKENEGLAKTFEEDMRKACAAPEFEKVAKIRMPYLSYCMDPKDTRSTVSNEIKTINRIYPK